MSCISNYNRWLEEEAVDETSKAILRNLSEEEKEDCFYKTLEFGTGGLRGVMGVGANRMNVYVIRQVTQGLAKEILSMGRENKSVVIAYDSRNNSKTFAKEAAKVLTGNGIKVYLFDDLRPTPELSFAVRYLKCVRGIVITASHNPKEYNGYKVYGDDGGQITLRTAEEITSYINETDIFDDIKISDTEEYITIGADVDEAYINVVCEQSTGVKIPKDFRVVYTPIHGSGNIPVRRVLKKIGTENVFVVPEQELPDGNFPTVKSPNPENSEAFTIAVEYAKTQNADVVLGTDPDGDRIGVVVRNTSGEYIVLNGNQTGSLLCEYILRKERDLKNGIIVKTIVTTEMVKAISKDFGVKVVDVLTGFKYIGDKIKKCEEENTKFLFGLEESYGYLKGTYARDKDAVVASMLVCEMAAEYKQKGLTLYDALQKLYKKHGYYLERLKTATLKGACGAEKIKTIMRNLRNSVPKEIAGQKVLEIKDYAKGIDNLPKSDVLKFILESGWIAARPSGTEPKIKFYFGVCEKNEYSANTALEQFNEYIDGFLN